MAHVLTLTMGLTHGDSTGELLQIAALGREILRHFDGRTFGAHTTSSIVAYGIYSDFTVELKLASKAATKSTIDYLTKLCRTWTSIQKDVHAVSGISC